MNYKICPAICLIIISIHAYSDLTMLHCPAQFNIPATNITTDTTFADMGQSLYSAFQSSSSIQKV